MKYTKLTIAFICIVLLNIMAWVSPVFCDWYVWYILPIWVNTYARVTSLFSFSVGEVMLGIGVVATIILVLIGVIYGVGWTWFRHGVWYSRSKEYGRKYLKRYIWMFVVVSGIMTLNCFIPYHCSPLEEKYGGFHRQAEENSMVNRLFSRQYTLKELGDLRDYIVIKCNELAVRMERDEAGDILLPENMETLLIEGMQRLGEDFWQLSGYYPRPKQLTLSGFFSQQMIKGYFFPFSLEANYNGLMEEINFPATICHEYAHLKGFMYEEEANMIGFLACIGSPDVTLQYSGYLSVLNYVNNEFYEAIGRNKAVYSSHVPISSLVSADNVFLKEETWEAVEKKAVLSTELVNKVSDSFTETMMALNGVEDGMRSYARVVELLLRYYDGSHEIQQILARDNTVTMK